MVDISLANRTISVIRPGLRKWLVAEEIRDTIFESADKKDSSGFVSGIYSFLSALAFVDEKEFENIPWYEVLEAYYLVSIENAPRLDLSIIKAEKKTDRGLPDAWEYKERLWYSWVDALAGRYGWNIEYISDLDVDDALALIQEISLREQFDREFQYSLSEIGYEFDRASKKSRLKPLPRPSWMSKATNAVKDRIEKNQVNNVVKPLPPGFLPLGNVVLDGQSETIKPEGNANSVSKDRKTPTIRGI